ncbi:MAG: sialidase family protein [Bacteroidota bacterium]
MNKGITTTILQVLILVLFTGCSAPKPEKQGDIITINACPWSPAHSRNDQQMIFPLKDGRLLLAWSEYYITKPSAVDYPRYEGEHIHDYSPCRISGKISRDSGYTWSGTFTLQDNTGRMNVKHPNFLRLPSGRILFFYTLRNAASMEEVDLQIYMKQSDDECETWSEPVRISSLEGMNFTNPDHVFMHSSGRIILPFFNGSRYGVGDHYQALCYFSDDGGATWKYSDNKMNLPERGAEEPAMVELSDSSLMAVLRTSMGTLYKSYSRDRGETWTQPGTTGLISPQSTPLLKRIPGTDDLLLVWNRNYDPDHGHGGERNPLSSALSKDDGKTWQSIKDVEDFPGGTAMGPSALFLDDKVLVAYAFQDRPMYTLAYGTEIRLKIIPLECFYQ